MSDAFYRPGTLTLTLEGDFGDLRFTLTEEWMSKPDPEHVDNTVRNLLTVGAKRLLDKYNNDLGGPRAP